MVELLKTDLKRVFKDKLLFVMGILAVVFALLTPLLYAVIFSVGNLSSEPMFASLMYSKGHFFEVFSMTSDMGLIVPVLLAIVLCKDFSHGTVRNKIIAGKHRSSIFLSMFITCALVLVSVIMLSAFLSLGISLIFFDYQATPFTMADFGYFMASLAFEVLVLLFMAALLSWLCACMKNVGIAIVLYVAFTFGLLIIGSIIQVCTGILQSAGGNDVLLDVLKVLDRINVGMSTMHIGVGNSYTLSDVLYLTLTPLTGILGFLGLGLLTFSKKDMK